MKKTILVLCFLLATMSTYSAPEDRAGTFSFPIIYLYLLGLGVELPYHPEPFLEGLETTLWTGLTFADISMNYFRDPTTGVPLDSVGNSDDLTYAQTYTQISLGLAQGILYNQNTDRNYLEAFAFYRGRGYFNRDTTDADSIILNTSLPDRATLIQNSLLFGLTLNDKRRYSPHYIFSGYIGEISMEIAPEALNFPGEGTTDFIRYNAHLGAWWPLFDLNRDGRQNVFSGMLGNFASVDYVTGTNIPQNALQFFGGRFIRGGLGGSVRGTDVYRYAAEFKAVFNTTLQVNIWGWYPLDKMGAELETMGIVPALIAYYDIGYFQAYEPTEDSGLLQSWGLGAFVNAANFFQIGVEWDFLIEGQENFLVNQFPDINIKFGYHY